MIETEIYKHTISKIKTQVCSAIANSEKVKRILGQNEIICKDYNTLIPCLYHHHNRADIDYIPLILVGVDVSYDFFNWKINSDHTKQYPTINADIKILCLINTSTIGISDNYYIDGLLEENAICTKLDLLADEIIECITKFNDNCFGRLDLIKTFEQKIDYPYYSREIIIKLSDINIADI